MKIISNLCFFFQISSYDGSKLHHDLVFPNKSLPIPLLEEIQQKEAFLQELQNQITGKSKRSSPLSSSSPVLSSTPIPPSPLLPFLPYLQHPYAPLPPSDTPWNLQHQEIIEKKPETDAPLNLTKPKSDDQPIKNASNDGNNNQSQTFEHAGSSKHLSAHPPRLPYNMSR